MTQDRGFAAMDPQEQRRIAEKGGQAVSRDREHMAEIGRKGGEARAGNQTERSTQQQTEAGRAEASQRSGPR